MNITVRAEDIMTARNLLWHGKDDADAEKIAKDKGFDAVPISRSDGKILDFWSHADKQKIRIRQVHRTAHDASIESLLAPLGDHIIQFVCYRSEVVGLINASDLNKPIARIAWLHPMLELERAVLDAVRVLKISDNEQEEALGSHAKGARKRQGNARRHDLEMPLLEYAQFSDLLYAGKRLDLLDLDDSKIDELNEVRKRAAHSGDVVVGSRSECPRLIRILEIARKAARHTQSLRHRKSGISPKAS